MNNVLLASFLALTLAPAQAAITTCNDALTALKPKGEACLQIANQQQRTACFDQAPSKAGISQELMQKCGQGGPLDQLKNTLMSQEKAKYPTQVSGFNSNQGPKNGPNNGPGNMSPGANNQGPNNGPSNMNQGPGNVNQGPGNTNQGPGNMNQGPGNMNQGPGNMNQGPGNMNQGPGNMNQGPGNMNQGGNNNGGSQVAPWPVAQCQAQVGKLRSFAEGCLKEKDQAKRCACIKGADAQFPVGFFKGACDSTFNPIKNEFIGKEHKAYPTQQACFN